MDHFQNVNPEIYEALLIWVQPQRRTEGSATAEPVAYHAMEEHSDPEALDKIVQGYLDPRTLGMNKSRAIKKSEKKMNCSS